MYRAFRNKIRNIGELVTVGGEDFEIKVWLLNSFARRECETLII